MNHAKNLASLTLASIIITGCAGYGSSSAKAPVTEADYIAAVNDAQTSINNAAKANNLWRDSGEILEKSAELAKAGDFEAAIKLANKAKRQGEMAATQAEDQKNAGPQL